MTKKNKNTEPSDDEVFVPNKTGACPTKALKIPKVNDATIEALKSADAEIRASGLVTIVDMVLPALPSNYVFSLRDRKFVENAFNATFDLIGGVPRLSVWAHQNPGEFYKIYAKLLPEVDKANNAMAAQINITNHIGRSPLDDETLNATHIVDADDLGDFV